MQIYIKVLRISTDSNVNAQAKWSAEKSNRVNLCKMTCRCTHLMSCCRDARCDATRHDTTQAKRIHAWKYSTFILEIACDIFNRRVSGSKRGRKMLFSSFVHCIIYSMCLIVVVCNLIVLRSQALIMNLNFLLSSRCNSAKRPNAHARRRTAPAAQQSTI